MADPFDKLKQAQAARLIRKSSIYLRDHSAPKNPDGTYSGRDIVAWHMEREIKKIVPKEENNDANRLKKAQADMAEHERDQLLGKFISVQEVHELFSAIALPMGRLMKKIQKRFGEDAVEILQTALDQSAEIMDSRIDPEHLNA